MRDRFVWIPSVGIYISGCSYMWMYFFFFSIYQYFENCQYLQSYICIFFLPWNIKDILSMQWKSMGFCVVSYFIDFHCRNKNSWNILKNMFYSAEERWVELSKRWQNIRFWGVVSLECSPQTLTLPCYHCWCFCHLILLFLLIYCSALGIVTVSCSRKKSSLLTLLLSRCSYSDVCVVYMNNCTWIYILHICNQVLFTY